jgi:hypothetical protein
MEDDVNKKVNIINGNMLSMPLNLNHSHFHENKSLNGDRNPIKEERRMSSF